MADLKKIGDDFEILSKLGKGGMGQVYLARQVSLDRTVAVKVLTKQHCANPEFIERFKREARLAGKFYHPHAIQVFDIGEYEGQYYYVMEYVDGGSLKEKLKKEGVFSEEYVIDVLLQLFSVLQEAEGMGIIHRDIKPDNIMINEDGDLKLADLGLAKEEEDDAALTQAKVALGTPHYMAPEQAQGKDVSPKADQYALGVTAFHFLTGETPFTGRNNMEILVKHVKNAMPKPSSINKKISAGMDKIILKMTEKDPSKRFGTIASAIKAIEALKTPTKRKIVSKQSSRKPSASESNEPKAEKRPVRKVGGDGGVSNAIMILGAGAVLAVAAIFFLGGSDTKSVTNEQEILKKIWSLKASGHFEEAYRNLKRLRNSVDPEIKKSTKELRKELQARLVKDKINEINSYLDGTVKKCEKGLEELEVLSDLYGMQRGEIKAETQKIKEKIRQINDRRKAEDEKANQLALTNSIKELSQKVSGFLEVNDFKKAREDIGKWKEHYHDSKGRVYRLISNIDTVEYDFYSSQMALAEKNVSGKKYKEAISLMKEYLEKGSKEENLSKVRIRLEEIIALRKKVEKNKKESKQKLVQTLITDLKLILNTGNVDSAKLLLKDSETRNKDDIKDVKSKLQLFIDVYSVVYTRVKKSLAEEYKDKLYYNEIGIKRAKGELISEIKEGALVSVYMDRNIKVEPGTGSWAPIFTKLATYVMKSKNNKTNLHLAIFAHINEDFDGARKLFDEYTAKGGKLSSVEKEIQSENLDDYFDWADDMIDGVFDRIEDHLDLDEKKKAKIIFNGLFKNFADSPAHEERKEEFDEYANKVGN